MNSKNAFNGLDGFPACDMGQPGWTDNVSSCKNSFDAGFVAVVHLDKALFVKIDLNTLRQDWRDSNGYQNVITFNDFGEGQQRNTESEDEPNQTLRSNREQARG